MDIDKKSKICIYVILALIAVISGYLFSTYVLGFGVKEANSTPDSSISSSSKEINNTVEENKIENTVENTVQNEPVNTVDTTTERPHSEVSYADAEEQAFKIAKQAWGDTEGVYFKRNTITPDGEYVIDVTDDDTKVLARYTINVDTGAYDVEYR